MLSRQVSLQSTRADALKLVFPLHSHFRQHNCIASKVIILNCLDFLGNPISTDNSMDAKQFSKPKMAIVLTPLWRLLGRSNLCIHLLDSHSLLRGQLGKQWVVCGRSRRRTAILEGCCASMRRARGIRPRPPAHYDHKISAKFHWWGSERVTYVHLFRVGRIGRTTHIACRV